MATPPDSQQSKRRRTNEADLPAGSSHQPTFEPRVLVLVTRDLRMLSTVHRDSIYDELSKRLVTQMLSPNLITPHFDFASKTNPFGLVFKAVNADAEQWLRNTVDNSPLPNCRTVVYLEEEVNVKMQAEVPLYPNYKETAATAFDILKNTNQGYFDTSRWNFVEEHRSIKSGNVAFHFEVPFSEASKLMSRKCYFLFGVVQVECYEEPKTFSRPILSVDTVSSQESQDDA